jgi:hypothetical protein
MGKRVPKRNINLRRIEMTYPKMMLWTIPSPGKLKAVYFMGP